MTQILRFGTIFLALALAGFAVVTVAYYISLLRGAGSPMRYRLRVGMTMQIAVIYVCLYSALGRYQDFHSQAQYGFRDAGTAGQVLMMLLVTAIGTHAGMKLRKELHE